MISAVSKESFCGDWDRTTKQPLSVFMSIYKFIYHRNQYEKKLHDQAIQDAKTQNNNRPIRR